MQLVLSFGLFVPVLSHWSRLHCMRFRAFLWLRVSNVFGRLLYLELVMTQTDVIVNQT